MIKAFGTSLGSDASGILVFFYMVLLLSGCLSRDPPEDYVPFRFRLGVEVEVDGRVISGSSVIEVQVQTRSGSRGEGAPHPSKVTGTAVNVELGQHGWLVAVVDPQRYGNSELPSDYPGRAFNFAIGTKHQPPYRDEFVDDPAALAVWAYLGPLPDYFEPTESNDDQVKLRAAWFRSLGDRSGRVELLTRRLKASSNDPAGGRRTLPQLLWFPKSLTHERFDPPIPLLPDEVSQWIAPGVRLRSIWVERTKEPVPTRFNPAPQWLTYMKAKPLDRFKRNWEMKSEGRPPTAVSIWAFERDK